MPRYRAQTPRRRSAVAVMPADHKPSAAAPNGASVVTPPPIGAVDRQRLALEAEDREIRLREKALRHANDARAVGEDPKVTTARAAEFLRYFRGEQEGGA